VERYFEIKSKENPLVRSLAALHDRKVARTQGKVFIEGLRLCEDAILSGLVPEVILIRSGEEAVADKWKKDYPSLQSVDVIVLTEALFSKLSSTKNPQGMALVVEAPVMEGSFPYEEGKSRYIVLEHLQDPGNMGTIIRMADAFGYTAVLFTEDSVDPYNEKVLRASMGSCFHIPLISFSDSGKIFDTLKEKNIPSIGAHLRGNDLRTVEFPHSSALWIGNEANGLSELTSSCCDILIKIPMPGRAESLNAASAASILGYLLAFAPDK
jgi:TrmH family RNA methyltransferase